MDDLSQGHATRAAIRVSYEGRRCSREGLRAIRPHLPTQNGSSLIGDQRKGEYAPKRRVRRHPNVKLCLSGHMHTQDRCEYRGVWYVCGGVGSGAWWNGSEYGFPPCYGAIDFFADGGFEYRFADYGWKAKTWRGQELKD